MNKVNFDSLTNYNAPEDWVKKAAAIPETTIEEKPAVVPFWRNRALVAAASLVLVSALSLLLYLSFGVKPPIEVKPYSPATEIIWSTDENGETVATEIVIVDDGTTVQNGTQPTEEKPLIEQLIDSVFGTESTSPTTASDSGRGRRTPMTKTNPTEKGNTDPTSKADPITPTEVVNAPTEAPAPPTDPPEPTEPSAQSNAPTPQIPTEGNNSAESVFSFFATFDASLLNEGETVYCIYSPAGYAAGTETAFEKQQADYFITKNGTVFASCDVLIDFPLPAEITAYQYYFVNERGHRLASGTQTV